MEVKVSYSLTQLEAAVKFIEAHHQWSSSLSSRKSHFIRSQIISCIMESARKFPKCISISTMGFSVEPIDVLEENMEQDENMVSFDILVDPSLGIKAYEDHDYHTEIITTKVDQNG